MASVWRSVACTLVLTCGAADDAAQAQGRAWYGVYGASGGVNISGVRSVDLVTGAAGPKVTIGAQANDIAVSPDGTRVYVARFDATAQDGLRVIDAATSQIVASVSIPFPLGVGTSPDGAKIYVASASGLFVVARATHSVTRIITGLGDARSIAVSPDGRWGYVPLGSSDRLAFVDLQSETVVSSIPVADYPAYAVLSPDGLRAFVGHVGNPTVTVIDTVARASLGTIVLPATGGASIDSLATPDGLTLYAAVFNGPTHIIDVATRTPRGTVPASAGSRLRGLTLLSGGRFMAALDVTASALTIVDTLTDSVVRTTPVVRAADEFSLGELASSGTLPPSAEYRFTFEELSPTAPPQSGALTSLEMRRGALMMVVSRPGSRFDVVDNTVSGQLGKPQTFGARSLDPFCCSASGGPFIFDFSEPIDRIAIDAGDYGDAADPVRLEAFSGPGASGTKVGEASVVVPAGPANAVQFTGATVSLESATPFRSVRIAGGEAAFPNSVFFDNVVAGWKDVDADGVPDRWESLYGLSTSSAAGDEGAAGDKDGDGTSNAAEFVRGGHPTGTSRQYLAEGATSSFFATRLALLNPSSTPGAAVLTLVRSAGPPIVQTLALPAQTRVTVDPSLLPGMQSAEFSVAVEANVPVVVDRTMSWGGGYGAHAETAVAAPARTWYLAEGSTVAAFNLFYLLQNPHTTPASVRIRYLRGSGAPLEKTYTLPARSRTTVWVNQEEFPGEGKALASADVSAVIQVVEDLPIIVERAMYMNLPGQTFGAGHESAGITTPATQWFLAEGATGAYFDLFVLIANPSSTDADVEATYLLPSGDTIVRRHVVPANARYNIWVDQDDPALRDTAVSTTIRVLNDVPVIVERSMWWPGSSASWQEAHNAPGARATAARWALAEGEVGGSDGRETYILIANTSETRADVLVQLMFEDGTSVANTFAVAPRSRFNVDVRTEFPAAADRRFGALVESVGAQSAALVVERAMYWDAAGQRWAAGTNALATAVP